MYLPDGEAWWHPSVEKCGPSWMDLGRLRKVTIMSTSQWASSKWWWSCKSVRIHKPPNEMGYAAVWHQRYDRSKISSDTKSIIVKLTIPVIRTQLNQSYTSKRRLPEEEAWRYLNVNQISITCPSRGCQRRHLIPRPQGGLKTRDVT